MPRNTELMRSTWVIALLTAVSRLLGLAREMTLAYYFSTSGILSAFRVAFMLPNLARRLFGEGALSAAMIPVLAETLRSEGEQESRHFIGRLLLAVLVLLAAGLVVVEVILLTWGRFSFDLALSLAVVLMPYMVIICLVALIGGILNVRRQFSIPAIMPVFLNAGIIIAALVGGAVLERGGVDHIKYICWGVLIAGGVQLLLSGVALRSAGFFPIFEWRPRDVRIRRVARLMGPMILGLSAVQVNSLADYLIAYFFVTENGEAVGPAILGYAQFLYQLPLGVFGIALATAIFPELARRGAAGDRAGLAGVMSQGVRLGFYIALPASVGLMFIAHPLVETLYLKGNFHAEDVRRVANALFYYAIGMGGYFAQHIVVRTYYAMHDTRTPARVALMMVVVNVAVNFSLVFSMQERGLALSTALCALVQVSWLALLLTRRLDTLDRRAMIRGLIRIVAATAIMALALGACMLRAVHDGVMPDSALGETMILIAIGVVSYGVVSRALRIPELSALFSLRERKPLMSDDSRG